MAINHFFASLFLSFFFSFSLVSVLFYAALLSNGPGEDFRHNLTVQQTEGGFMELRHPCTVIAGGDHVAHPPDPSAVDSSSSTIARLKAIACE